MKCFYLDANAVNARQANLELNRLEELRAAGKLDMDFSRLAYDEASAGDDVKRLEKVEESIWIGLMRAILITSNGGSKSQPRGILGSEADLAKIGIRVMSPSEALEEALKEEPDED